MYVKGAIVLHYYVGNIELSSYLFVYFSLGMIATSNLAHIATLHYHHYHQSLWLDTAQGWHYTQIHSRLTSLTGYGFMAA